MKLEGRMLKLGGSMVHEEVPEAGLGWDDVNLVRPARLEMAEVCHDISVRQDGIVSVSVGGEQLVSLIGVVETSLVERNIGVGRHVLQVLSVFTSPLVLGEPIHVGRELLVVVEDDIIGCRTLEPVPEHAVRIEHQAEAKHVVDVVISARNLHQCSVCRVIRVESGLVDVVGIDRRKTVDGRVGHELEVLQLHGSSRPKDFECTEELGEVPLLPQTQGAPVLVDILLRLLHEGELDLVLRAYAGR